MKNICIDIGNSMIKISRFVNGRIGVVHTIATSNADQCVSVFQKKTICDGDRIAVCSVVPAATKKIKRCIKATYALAPSVVSENVAITVPSGYAKKTPLGNDRVVNLYGALARYKAPFIVVSFGTAITVDYVDSDGVHCGGYIFPGLTTAMDSLGRRTAALSSVALKKTQKAYGTDTASAVQTGVIYGSAAAVDGLVAKLKKQSRKKTTTIAVGGDAAFMHDYCTCLDIISEFHTLFALNDICALSR